MSSLTVILAEKRNVASDIASVIGNPQPIQGGFTCANNTIVTFASGHLIRPYDPDEYNEEWKSWTWDTLPLNPPYFKFKPKDEKAAKQLKLIGSFFAKASEVWMATDPDREGELIGYETIKWLKFKGPVKRLWIRELNAPAIRKALQNLKPIAETTPYAHAALARQEADWHVGMSMSRAATLKMRNTEDRTGPLSIGRVQTPTLAMIVRREKEITGFVREKYYELFVDVTTQDGHKLRLKLQTQEQVKNKKVIEDIAGQIQGKSGRVFVKEEMKKQEPPKLLDLSKLQQQANVRFGMSADETLKAAQSLYDIHKLLTYPRTEETVISEEDKAIAGDKLDMLASLPEFGGPLSAMPEPKLRKSVYGPVVAHSAIIPTLTPPDLSQLNEHERNIYLLSASYYIASHMPDYEYLARSVGMKIDDHRFMAKGTTPKSMGWREVFGGKDEVSDDDKKSKSKGSEEGESDQEPETEIPPVKDGDQGRVDQANVQEKETTPPARFTEASLINAMKSISRFVQDERAKKILSETAGLGTAATRAGIIELLKRRKFIEVEKRKLVPTPIGTHLIDAVTSVIPTYADPVWTAFWEDKLDGIVAGSVDPKTFVEKIRLKIAQDIEKIKASTDLTMVSSPGQAGGGAAKTKGNGQKRNGKSNYSGKPIDENNIVKLKVPFDRKDEAKALGARFAGTPINSWYIDKNADPSPFKKAGFL